VALFGSILLNHSKTINSKAVSFLNLYAKRSNKKALQFLRLVSSLKTVKTSKGMFRYSIARPPKAWCPGHLPGLLNG